MLYMDGEKKTTSKLNQNVGSLRPESIKKQKKSKKMTVEDSTCAAELLFREGPHRSENIIVRFFENFICFRSTTITTHVRFEMILF